MEQTTMQRDALAITQKNMRIYFETHDLGFVAKDGVFINMATGERYTGHAEIGAMLHYFYHVAFDARAEIKSSLITESKAVLEAEFEGIHIGEFAGIAATNKQVKVPMCVTYDLRKGLIQEARIYLMTSVMLQQLGVL